MSKNKSSVASLNTREYDELIAVLVEVRKEKRFGQKKLSLALGHDKNYIYKIESKDRRIDVVEFLFFARALEIEPSELFARYVRRLSG